MSASEGRVRLPEVTIGMAVLGTKRTKAKGALNISFDPKRTSSELPQGNLLA